MARRKVIGRVDPGNITSIVSCTKLPNYHYVCLVLVTDGVHATVEESFINIQRYSLN